MERSFSFAQNLLRPAICTALALWLAGCGNGGSIDFQNPGTTPGEVNNRGADTSFVPASVPLATGGGYSAKLQLNPLKGTTLSGSGYTLKLKHTTRNR